MQQCVALPDFCGGTLVQPLKKVLTQKIPRSGNYLD
jgi:hypothetical protein